MGLDMYLVKKTYVKNHRFTKPEERYQVTVTKGGEPADVNPERITAITEEVAYWRKANHIHKWFVDNVQDGADDCKEYYVTREELQELLSRCEKVIAASELVDGKVTNGYTYDKEKGMVPIIEDGKVIANPSVAQELLPTQDGFFFVNTDYDAWYLDDVKETVEMLKLILGEGDSGSFYYQSSW
jgi:hypothetical protein